MNDEILSELKRTNRLLTLLVLCQGESNLQDELLKGAVDAIKNSPTAQILSAKKEMD
ncbi:MULTISPECIES: hypothetical protein [Levilactobacillus]|uniref:Uncharacterized protein n=1 Tax=Lactobacillus phage LBR48 TaxID=755164 RepID=D6PST1_9CAUD|nr:hypothetical protein [Levilactobacillus senmaizukei]YP_009168547.1 hypothetical protein APL41_gp17 [Lactobacillus phage LBR48]ADF83422.1 hypothetical protein [Lactobacillus phage LBR48]